MENFELLTEFSFSFKDSGITVYAEALDFVEEFVSAAIPKLTRSYDVTYQLRSDYDDRFACGEYFYVVLSCKSDVQLAYTNEDDFNSELDDIVLRDVLPEIQDLFIDALDGNITFEVIRAFSPYGISNFNKN